MSKKISSCSLWSLLNRRVVEYIGISVTCLFGIIFLYPKGVCKSITFLSSGMYSKAIFLILLNLLLVGVFSLSRYLAKLYLIRSYLYGDLREAQREIEDLYADKVDISLGFPVEGGLSKFICTLTGDGGLRSRPSYVMLETLRAKRKKRKPFYNLSLKDDRTMVTSHILNKNDHGVLVPIKGGAGEESAYLVIGSNKNNVGGLRNRLPGIISKMPAIKEVALIISSIGR